MRAEVTPSRAVLVAGTPVHLVVTVTNTLPIVAGYQFSVLGLDPDAVSSDRQRLALFPETSGSVTLTLTIPPGLPAGVRTLTVSVTARSLKDTSLLLPVELVIPADPKLTLRLNPRSLTAGRRAPFALIAENQGNSHIRLPLVGIDEEAAIRYAFTPRWVDVEPGGRQAIDVELSARRRLAGQLAVRSFALNVGDPDELKAGKDPLARTSGTFIQKPVVSRGAFSLVGLLAAISVFALILTVALTRVSSQSTADRDLALAVAMSNASSANSTGTSGISGTVSLLTSGAGVGGVTVDIFEGSDTSNAVATAATDDNGTYSVAGLPSGSYKIRYRGAGFAELWYPDSLTDSDATAVTVDPSAVTKNLNVQIGGLPATISGTVTGVSEAGAGASVTLQVAGNGPPVITPLAPDDSTADGEGLPTAPVATAAASPTVVALPVIQTPAATATTTPGLTSQFQSHVVLPHAVQTAAAAKRARAAPSRTPKAGPSKAKAKKAKPRKTATPQPSVPDTEASGLAGAVIQTVTADSGGAFSFSQVPSPATYDLVVRKLGFAITTERIDVTGGEVRKDVLVRLQQGDGIISGRVTDNAGPVRLATLTASNGLISIQTYSDANGAFTLRGMTTPGSYIVSVTKANYATQQLSFQLSAAQQLTNVTVTLSKAASAISGRVSYLPPVTLGDPSPVANGASGVSVTVTNGQVTLATETSTDSAGAAGDWSLSGLPTATTYTITFSRPDLAAQTVSVTLDAQGNVVGSGTGDSAALSPTLTSATAVFRGVVTQAGSGTGDLGGIAVALSSTSTTYSVTTVSQPSPGAAVGYFEIDGIIPGTYTISAGRTGSTTATQVVVLKAGDDLLRTLSLALPASVSGTVYDNTADKEPVARAEVHLYKAANYPNTASATVLTDANGHYTFPDIDAPQDYVIDADFPAGSAPSTSQTFTIDASETKTVDLYLNQQTTNQPSTNPPSASPTPSANPPSTSTTPNPNCTTGAC